jgi:hypothetical protein
MEFRILGKQEEVHRLDWNNLFSLRPLPGGWEDRVAVLALEERGGIHIGNSGLSSGLVREPRRARE